MKYGKKLFAAVLAAAILISAGCASTNTARPQQTDAAPLAAEAVTLSVPNETSYTDVAADAWYAEAVAWCQENGLMGGVGQGAFSPDGTMERAMMATVLHRAAGTPASEGGETFTDVEDGLWYSDAIAWSSASGYLGGYGNGTFGTHDSVTREQVAAILWRYQGNPDSAGSAALSDSGAVSAYAVQAVNWAVGAGALRTRSDGSFAPAEPAVRAEVAYALYQIFGADSADNTNTGGTSTVYMTTNITSEGLMAVYEALGVELTGDNIAVKLSTGEPPASNYLRPELIADLVEYVDGTIVECNTAYGGSRSETAMHYQVAEDHGFTTLGKGFVIMDEGGESMIIPVEGGQQLEENYVGARFDEFDGFLVLSHFKGHQIAGYGGAIKNISIGIGSQEGKNLIHTAGRSHTSWFGGEQNAFLESMADAGKSVVDYLDGNILFINVMNRLSIDCDCNGRPAEPDIHDIGILASTDPVALDQACLDLIYQAEGNEAFVRRVEGQNGAYVLEAGEAIGLGSRDYTLVSIDD